jgi:hypothetical protein
MENFFAPVFRGTFKLILDQVEAVRRARMPKIEVRDCRNMLMSS